MNDHSFEDPQNRVYLRGSAVCEVDVENGNYTPVSVIQDRTLFDPLKYRLALLAHEYPDLMTLNTKTSIIEDLKGETRIYGADFMNVAWTPNPVHESPLFLGWNIHASVYNTDWSNSILEIYRVIAKDYNLKPVSYELIAEGRFSGDINIGVLNFANAITSNIASEVVKADGEVDPNGKKKSNSIAKVYQSVQGNISDIGEIAEMIKFTDESSLTSTRIIEPIPMMIAVKCNNAILRVTPVTYSQEIASKLVSLGDNIQAADIMRLVKNVIQ
jgi:hypothetical protein